MADKHEKPDKKPDAAPEGGAEAAAPAKKKLPVKTLGIVAGLMLAEGALIFVVMGMTGKAPDHAVAEVHGDPHAADLEAPVEIMLIEDEKLQNLQNGRVWIWDTSIYLKVKERHRAHVEGEMAARTAEIKQGIAEIVRRAQHTQLKEPGLETLTRQLTAFCNDIFGTDAEGHPYVDRVLIPKCRGFPADF